MVRTIFDEVLLRGTCYENLRVLCKDVGNRLSGSAGAAKAVVWGQKTLDAATAQAGKGGANVFLQEVMVPRWERGAKESCTLEAKGQKSIMLDVLALGGSIATPANGIKAEIIEIHQFKELDSLGEKNIKGKIVFFNRPFSVTDVSAFSAYGGCVNQRVDGASQAAKYGALAVLARSMTHALDRYPHTGVMIYADSAQKIPAAAVSTLSARLIHDAIQAGKRPVANLKLFCRNFPNVPSHNVIAEIRGSELPNEYIVVGGHLDSWDTGEGAHDDGTGVVQSIEVLRILIASGYKPKRTIRAVLFMNEENGAMGAKEYAAQAAAKGEKHYAAIESDRGGFTPRGFAVQDTGAFLRFVQGFRPVLAPYGFTEITTGFGGVDIGPLGASGTHLLGYLPDSQRYFDHHHAQTDVFEAVNKRELELGAGGMAAMVYLLDQYGAR